MNQKTKNKSSVIDQLTERPIPYYDHFLHTQGYKPYEILQFEEFFYYVMQECTRIIIDYFFDEFLGWNYSYPEEYQEVSDLDEIEEWEF